jgi:hypothetical protein
VLHCDKEPCFGHIEVVRKLSCSALNRFEQEWLELSQDLMTSGWLRLKGLPGHMAVDRRGQVLAWGALLIAALALGGCSTTIADLPAVGTPGDAPERPKEAGAYLPVHDLPPDRQEAVIPAAEQRKIQAELIAARERQAAAIGAKDGKANSGAKTEANSKSDSKSKSKAEAKAEAKVE